MDPANSGHGPLSGTIVMTIFGLYVSIPIPNIEKFRIYEVYKSWEVFPLFSQEISC